MTRSLDYAASPTLSAIREVAGEAAAVKLVTARGGTWVHLPVRLSVKSELVRIVGAPAARAILDHFGGGTPLRIPTGRGHGHGRRIDHAEVVRLHDVERWSVKRLALHMGCTDRQILKILASARRPGRDPRQEALFDR